MKASLALTVLLGTQVVSPLAVRLSEQDALECSQKTPHQDGVIVVLVPAEHSMRKDTSDYDLTLRALRSLQKVRGAERSQVRIFHDVDDKWPAKHLIPLLAAAAPRDACTVAYKLAKFPKGMNKNSVSPWTTPLRKHPSKWGYEHMIRFFFADLFETDILKGFTYWMRLDSDALFTTPVEDPFRVLDERASVAYLRNEANEDCGPKGASRPRNNVAKGLRAFAHKWAQRLGRPDVAAVTQARDDCVLGFYNNAEVGRIAAFQTEDMQRFRDAVNQSKGIYRHRWGDALLRRLSVEFYDVQVEHLPKDYLESYCHGCR